MVELIFVCSGYGEEFKGFLECEFHTNRVCNTEFPHVRAKKKEVVQDVKN